MNRKLMFYITLVFPGLGQAINKQYKKAFVGLLFFIMSWISVISLIIPTLSSLVYYNTAGEYEGKYTIGRTPWVPGAESFDDSFLIIVLSVFSILLLLVLVFVAYMFARDARSVRDSINNDEEVVTLKEKLRAVAPDLIPHAITTPAYVLMFLFMIVPAIVSIVIVFTNYKTPVLPPAFLIEWAGMENYVDLFTDPSLASVFKETFVWTMVWTFCATTLTIVLGTFLAVVLHNKRIKGKKFFRMVYLLPWAVPAFLTILIFQIFFSKVGAMNTIILPFFTGTEYTSVGAVGFLLDPQLAKMTIILIQAWLGFPFVFVLVTGILQAIPDDLYEASGIDGGNAWTNFWDITFPLIMIAAAPMLITQYTFNFNNVTIIYLLGGAVVKPLGSTYGPLETIASLGYQLTLDAQYATAAAFTLISSIIVSVIVLISWMKTGAFKNEELM